MKVKSCNALIRMLLLCISICLESVLKYKFLMLDSYHLDTVYLREQGSDDSWLFLKPKGSREQERLGTLV